MNSLAIKTANITNKLRLFWHNRQVQTHRRLLPGERPVAFFNASTRIGGLSQNAVFAYLVSLGVQYAHIPVVHFYCHAGMSRCVLGTNKDNPAQEMPCRACTALSGWLLGNAPAVPFHYAENPDLAAMLRGMDLQQMSELEYPAPGLMAETVPLIPLGKLTLPSIRWSLRRHHLQDDEPTRFLLRAYLLSAYRVAQEFYTFLENTDPRMLVVFNGIMFPEAIARWVAQQRGLPIITHEVGLQPFTVFMSLGDATAYPISIPDSFQLTEAHNARLDAYLEKRFQGKFTMAGIRFWPEMSSLDEAFLNRLAQFRQMVPVFTNVIFDTSQVHANMVYPHMFAWLDAILDLMRAHPETLFVLRAHPDEMRPGKASQESVAGWVRSRQVEALPNVVFFNSDQFISSYEMIRRAKFVLVYNSSIGMEAALMGAAVLNGGKARYTQLPMVYFPQTPDAQRQLAEEFLAAERVEAAPQFRLNARRFLYYQLYRTSLPFEEFLEAHPNPSLVRLRSFPWQRLAGGENGSKTLQIIVDGILNDGPFLLEE